MVTVVSLLASCGMTPQIVDPYSDGFSEDEYLVIKVKDTDQLGQLFEALPEVDKDGKRLPLRWRQTTIMIFPTGASDVNKIKETTIDQTRQAFEKVKLSGKLTVAAIADMSASNESAYKYEAKASNAARLDQTSLSYTQKSKDYITTRLAQDKNYKFSYMSALYKGTAFVEVLKNVNGSGTGGNQAAFQIGSEYYQSGSRSTVTSGPIIFQLSEIDPIELGITATQQKALPLKPLLSNPQLQEILRSTTSSLHKMIQ